MPHRWELAVPGDVLDEAMEELSQGVCLTIESSSRLWQQNRMSTSELESLLRSVAWQSPTLKGYFEDQAAHRRDSDEDEPFDVMSAADLLELQLMADAVAGGGCEGEHKAKKARTDGDDVTRLRCPAAAMEAHGADRFRPHGAHPGPAPGARENARVHSLKPASSVHNRSFRGLGLCASDDDDDGSIDMAEDLQKAFFRLGGQSEASCCESQAN